jgi:V/A-type H+-transporting ATPase subunit A
VGYFLKPGASVSPLDTQRKWVWAPVVEPGDMVLAGDPLGKVPESIFGHPIMVPFSLSGEFKVESVAKGGEYTIEEDIATLIDPEGQKRTVSMQQT